MGDIGIITAPRRIYERPPAEAPVPEQVPEPQEAPEREPVPA